MVMQKIPVYAVRLAARYPGKVYANSDGVQFLRDHQPRAYGRTIGFGLGQGKGHNHGK
jgi:hypothetical protein